LDIYQQFIATRTYCRWLEKENRRESFQEAIDRYTDYFSQRIPDDCIEEFHLATKFISSLDVMPSMRCLWAAGQALDREAIAGYNCAYLTIDNYRAFAEVLYILMNGTGVGFSVERQFVNKLPSLPEEFKKCDKHNIVFSDSKRGWAEGFLSLLKSLYQGFIPEEIDYSRIRPEGSRLKTFGGRACLTGDTIVYKDRKKSRGYNEITLHELYQMQNSDGFWKNKANHFKDVKLRCLNEETGKFYRNNLLEVIDNGVAKVYEILTRNGYRIKATDNHRFMDATGEWRFVRNFEVGDEIAVNGSKEIKTGVCIDCGTAISRRAKRCRTCASKNQQKADSLHTTARQRKECRDYLGKCCERCGADNTRLVIHHKDKDPYNNNHSNLETLCESCHRVHHTKECTYGNPYSHKYVSYDEIISINYAGEEQVYDLAMKAPDHNFVANGFVSHNSGPRPLKQLCEFTINLLTNAKGRKLSSLECYDLTCFVANCVVVGGVRRSATISLSNLSDDKMRHAKDGQFWNLHPYRALSNNSVAYTEKPSSTIFLEEWNSLIKGGSGERGIINREAFRKKVESIGREYREDMGVNPCGEIILRPNEFCNLSEVVIKSHDDVDSLKPKVRAAVIFGMLQSTLTKFNFIRKEWIDNTEEERLLGVSITGVCDNPTLKAEDYKTLRDYAHEVAAEWANKLAINKPKAITCVKPSGTVSQLVNSASGLHPRFSNYYIRRVRVNSKDPLANYLVDKGVPWSPEVSQTEDDHTTKVFAFPIKSPDNCVVKDDMDAIDQLNHWRMLAENWTDHNPSATIYVADEEWVEVGAWVYRNWDKIGGLSFLPRDGNNYPLMPYEEITEEEYNKLKKSFPEDIDFVNELRLWEKEDATEGSREFACTGDKCEL